MNPERYFTELERQLDTARSVAERARARGEDPSDDVEIPVARDMADRVENILGIDGVAARVRELEDEYAREKAALVLVEDFVDGTVGDYETREGKIEGAVRTAVALLTEGVVAAPIEGIDRVEIRQNDDGSAFVSVAYAGPIRSAGGTAQALSVLVADYARSLLGIEEYHPRDDEVERYVEEVGLYDDETGLQYSPKDAETRYIATHCPIMLDGEATGEEEVSGYRDLERVDTNAPRGGLCLVLAEGIALKAPKIQRYTRDLEEVEWPWLEDLIDGAVGQGEDGAEGDEEAPRGEDTPAGEADDSEESGTPRPRPDPSSKYLRDLIAGRPVFGHPSQPGGFRLRYGRARNHGFATAGVHPATMHILDDFLATGTQIKTERPGKAAGVVPVDTIEGPTVKLANGDVRRIEDPAEAKEVRNGVEAVLDLGEYLVNYGEFIENNQPLAPASYTVEWWTADMEAAGANVQALRDSPHIDLTNPTVDQALAWASDHDAPLHPAYTYLWHDVSPTDVVALARAVAEGDLDDDTLVLDRTEPVRTTLEALLVEHHQTETALRIEDWRPLARTLGLDADRGLTWEPPEAPTEAWADTLAAVNDIAPFTVQERAPTRVGNRMGRPEKSESRDLSPAVHTLFPIGEAGGNQRDIGKAASNGDGIDSPRGQIEVDVGVRRCPDCGTHTYRPRCQECEARTEPHYECDDCGVPAEPDEAGRVTCPRCDREVDSVRRQQLDLEARHAEAHERVGERDTAYDIMKGVKGLTSATKTPEPLEKGVLRAKHGVTAFKDGTVRYDMTDLPVSAVRPAELDVGVDRFRELGYEEDINGEPLRHDDQLVPLRVQDIVLSDGAASHLLRTADFVDDLLAEYYDLDPYYEAEEREDLVGELVFGLAPHTSAAVVGRVVGFTSAAVGYAHPFFHAAKRRNCFHPETTVRYRDSGDTFEETTIEALVESHLEPASAETDDLGAVVSQLDGSVEVPSMTPAGEVVVQPVTAVSRHPAPAHFVAIRTEAGRHLRVTPDHDIQVRTPSGSFERRPAHTLEAGDRLAHPMASPTEDRRGVPDGGQASEADAGESEPVVDPIATVEYVPAEVSTTYNLTVAETHTLVAEDLAVAQCDGDEDCVMLLMDGLLNFSKSYLPDRRGGRMDAPLVMSSRIDPTEIDDEAHNVDIVPEYPREFYEATREMADPESIAIRTAEDTLGSDAQYGSFPFTHDTSDIAGGPSLSAYKTLGSMTDKMEAQLELARKLRAVDEADVAERVIESHFLPDLMGNLRAFSRQETRCLDCGTKYRRMPLSGDCRECGGDVNLTVHEGSVSKYMETALEVAEEYGARGYTRQRLEILERTLESLFENDQDKQSGIADFM
ncbi:MAG: DNA-directed DNA polymerase II large subunit [Halobacteriaceae archaeon]